MPPSDEYGNGPVLLQLRKWNSSQFKLELSEFCEAFISPTRELLLLLSYQHEGILVPLIAGEIFSSDGDDSFRPYTEEPEGFDRVLCTSELVDIVPIAASASNCYPVISNVKSLAWGHWGDTYGETKDHGFRELLIVSDCNGIIVHVFCCRDENQSRIESATEVGTMPGRWTEWGPTQCAHANDLLYSHPQSSEILNNENGVSVTNGRLHTHGIECVDSQSGCTATKKWFRTYLTEVDSLDSGGKFLAMFPAKSSLPVTAEVVSFSIYDSTLKFLEYFSCSSQKESPGPGTMGSLLGDKVIADSTPATSSIDCEASHTDISYKCSGVFYSSSHHLVGIVLAVSENASLNTCDEHLQNAKDLIVVVVKLYHWGLQWICAEKPGNIFRGPGPGPEWADFQFSGNFLVCLNSIGLIYICNATNGSPITCFDVQGSCGVISKNDSLLNKLFLASQRDSASRINSSGEEINEDLKMNEESETCSRDSLSARKFRRLLVSLHSSLLAAVDEHGLVYVVCAGDSISEKHNAFDDFVVPGQYSKLGVLHTWNIAGHDICDRKVLPDLKNVRYSNASDTSVSDLPNRRHNNDGSHRGAGKQYAKGKRRQVANSASGFSFVQHIKDALVPYLETKMSSTPMRRIFLPPNKFKVEEPICFSPFGITRLIRGSGVRENNSKIVHTCLYVDSSIRDERDFNTCFPSSKLSISEKESTFIKGSVGCVFQGSLYVVTQEGLFVILPSVSVSPDVLSFESFRYWQPSAVAECKNQRNDLLITTNCRKLWRPWEMEILDRVLLFEGPEEAEYICSQNDWDLKIVHLRRMQLALHYLMFDEIKKSLDMLAQVNLAEEGILRLLFTSLYHISCKGGDNEVAFALRLLSLAACFGTTMVRKYGLRNHRKDVSANNLRITYLQPSPAKHHSIEISYSRRLFEMANFLEVIRNLQSQLTSKGHRPGQAAVLDGRETSDMEGTRELYDDSPLPLVTMDGGSSCLPKALGAQAMATFSRFEFQPNNIDKLALAPTDLSLSTANLLKLEGAQTRKLSSLEKSKDMIMRWEIGHLDLRMVVKDALQSGRLPLAVLQLHIQQQKELASEDSNDTFNEVRKIGRAIAYDLFLEGESGLAVETLQKLGEDIETILRQLLFGTVRRSLRARIAEEMKKYGYLRIHELHTLEKISLIEMVYPSSSFWVTYHGKKKEINDAASRSNEPEANTTQIMLHICDNFTIECGDIDGIASGVWANIDDSSASSEVGDRTGYTGYWACAFVWSNAWDDRTMERVVLDQPFHMGVHIPWESQFEYHMSHNDLEEICKLLDMIPSSFLADATLKVKLDFPHSAGNAQSNTKFRDCETCLSSAEELDPVYMTIRNVRCFKFSAVNRCSSWLKTHIERKLAKKYIFLQEYWGSTNAIVMLLSNTGLIINQPKFSDQAESLDSSPTLELTSIGEQVHENTAATLHKLIIRFCTQYNLPILLDIYLDHQELVQDERSLCLLLEAAGDCQWAKWLLFSRVKGHEYEASFYNAHSNLSRHIILSSNLTTLDIDDIIRTVDDMAEGGGEMAALGTIVHAPSPIQKCIYSGSVKRQSSLSSQCTLENLRPGLQQFPTFWRTLVMSCFGQDLNGCSLSSSATNAYGNSAFSDFLKWRNNIFSSTGGDTSLTQMLPCWFPKSIRRLLKLFVQGPLGWHSQSGLVPIGEHVLHADSSYAYNANRNAAASAISWESNIQKSIEEELYSSLEENVLGVEHHLHRGRPLAAFSHLLGLRALKLKSAQDLSLQNNVQSEVQMLLAPLSQNEESLLLSIMPLAIMHFKDNVLVASCTFLLELCGVSASMLRVDIAALQRISSYYSSVEHNSHHELPSPKGSTFNIMSHDVSLTISLARALADEYVNHGNHKTSQRKGLSNDVPTSKQPAYSLITVLQHLERASLPSIDEGGTCGTWLSSGIGDWSEFRSLQKHASHNWKLVTTFCQMHHVPLSTKYLALLANDNDWVGFLTEAQSEGFSMDTIVQVATNEFRDPRLKTHILTVLRSTQSAKKTSSTIASASESSGISFLSQCSTINPIELFVLLAECEQQKNPGEALLIKAKDLRWPLLAIIASCFFDTSPLSCLTVWLEITAARETSLIKVNDIYARITQSVGAAVEVTNALPTGSRTLTFRYNRKNPKRRRLESESGISTSGPSLSSSTISGPSITSIVQEITSEEQGKRIIEQVKVSTDVDEGLASLSNMVAVLCEQHLFLTLLRAFEMFLPSYPLLPFVRSLQAFSQMRLSEASAHLALFSTRIKEEPFLGQSSITRDAQIRTTWISSIAVKAADAMLSTCPSAYERRCLLQLLSTADFGDGGSASTHFQRLYWKINLAEPSLRKDDEVYLGDETLDDDSLLMALEKNGQWEKARNWARLLESSGPSWKSAIHHVTETQAEAMVAEWKEFLWDVPEERSALWNHCQTLFLRYSFPPLQAGAFFLKHAEAIENEIPAKELHEMLLLSLQWLSGILSQCNPVYPLHLLREIETRVWLLAVESEAQSKVDANFTSPSSVQNLTGGNGASIIEQTASIITNMDNHINAMRMKATERNGIRDATFAHQRHLHIMDSNNPVTSATNARTKRRAKMYPPLRRPVIDGSDSTNDTDDNLNSPHGLRSSIELCKNQQSQEENVKLEASVSGWEEKVRPAEMERAVLSLLEFGQITAAKQLQQKLSPSHVLPELVLVDAALKLAVFSSSGNSGEASEPMLDQEVHAILQSHNVFSNNNIIDPMQALEHLASKCGDGCGRGLCWRIIAVVKVAKVLCLSFPEAFEKRPLELLQLLSLKAQESLEEAKLLVQTHPMPSSSIARILAESFLKGLLAAHRGGYIDSQKEEGPAPLLWRFSDFLKWAELCPSEQEIGHALMRLVMTGQEIPHACEVELLILAHHFYKSSACLDGVDVLVTLAANRVESYVLEGDFACLARLITGVSNFHALNFIFNILIENGQLELLLQKYSAAESSTSTAETVRGFRMAVLTSLKLFNPHDLDAFAMVYNHFDMKHETASLLESRSQQCIHQWFMRRNKEYLTEDLLESMHYLIEAAEVHSTIDAGHKTHRACARASLLSLQIRISDFQWIDLSETNARRVLVEQSRFQEALIVAEAYNLNQPGEWALVLWNQMLKPDLVEQFMAEFVAVLPLQPSMLLELARFYRAEVAARGDQSHFSVWLSPGGLPAEWMKHLGRSFRSLLRRTRDLRVRAQLATVATGFTDVIDSCMKVLDKVPDNAGPLILRKGHGGAYLPLM